MSPMLVLDDWLDDDGSHDLATGGQSRAGAVPIPGTLVGDVYRVVRTLGTGSMGVVLLAHDERLERDVAIKLPHSSLLSARFRQRLLEEARAMARVNHPGVVQIHAFGEHEGAPYFVMEWVAGPTLEQWLALQLPEPDVGFRILDDVCQGVAAIHAANTVHHDIKPSNVLLDDRLRPRVADLGLAALYRRDEPSAHEIVGTPGYMAPEIVFAKKVDPDLRARADIYSLGCLAYEVFTGRAAFEGTGPVGTLLQHAMRPVDPPSSVRPALPRALDDVVLRAMAKDPGDRTPTVDAFCGELRLAREGAHEPTRILVAEDDEDFREALRLYLALQFPSAEIECVGDGSHALRAAERKAPSVAIVDLRMPGLDGMELTRQLRARHSASQMPIIVLTASGGPEDWARLAALGANRFLIKPVVLDDVVFLVRRVLRERAKSPVARTAV